MHPGKKNINLKALPEFVDIFSKFNNILWQKTDLIKKMREAQMGQYVEWQQGQA